MSGGSDVSSHSRLTVRAIGGTRALIARIIRKPANLWSGHPGVDVALTLTVVGIHLLVVHTLDHGALLGTADQSQRLAVYAAGAGMMSLVAGFAGTAIAQYGSSSGPVVSALRSTHGGRIRRNWMSITAWLLIGTLLCVSAMTVDSKGHPSASPWLFEAAMVIAMLKFARLIFLFSLIMSAVDSEAQPARPKKTLTRLPRKK